MEAFLQIYPLTAFEAQILIEVCKYREHHIDISTLTKTLPKEFFSKKANDVDSSVKSLIERGLIEPYPSKKDELCVLLSRFGREIAWQIRERCFSEALRHFDQERNKIDARRKRLCVDPLGLKVGEKRHAKGPKGSTEIEIAGLFCSDNKYSSSNGRVEYERRVVARIMCPQCNSYIPIEYCFNPVTLYKRQLELECKKCGYKFFLPYYLYKYWE